MTGGRLDPPTAALLAGSRDGRGVVDLSRWLSLAAVALLLLEIATRRLGLFAGSGSRTGSSVRGVFKALRSRAAARRASEASYLDGAGTADTQSSGADDGTAGGAEPKWRSPGITAALKRARERVRRRS